MAPPDDVGAVAGLGEPADDPHGVRVDHVRADAVLLKRVDPGLPYDVAPR